MVSSAPRNAAVSDIFARFASFGAVPILSQGFSGAKDNEEQVVEIVGHAACQLADRVHFLRVAQLLLNPSLLRRSTTKLNPRKGSLENK